MREERDKIKYLAKVGWIFAHEHFHMKKSSIVQQGY
jgi:hypothetical protein